MGRWTLTALLLGQAALKTVPSTRGPAATRSGPDRSVPHQLCHWAIQKIVLPARGAAATWSGHHHSGCASPPPPPPIRSSSGFVAGEDTGREPLGDQGPVPVQNGHHHHLTIKVKLTTLRPAIPFPAAQYSSDDRTDVALGHQSPPNHPQRPRERPKSSGNCCSGRQKHSQDFLSDSC